jgi:ribulose-bisphosphate carboxylase small chain
MARITQGTFSLLPDCNVQIKAQVEYSIKRGFSVGLEWTDPHPRNCYWEMWGLPLFEIQIQLQLCMN